MPCSVRWPLHINYRQLPKAKLRKPFCEFCKIVHKNAARDFTTYVVGVNEEYQAVQKGEQIANKDAEDDHPHFSELFRKLYLQFLSPSEGSLAKPFANLIVLNNS